MEGGNAAEELDDNNLLYLQQQLLAHRDKQDSCHLPLSSPSNLTVQVSLPVMAVVRGLTLQCGSSLQRYHAHCTTRCDLQLLLLQGHLDHNHPEHTALSHFNSLSNAASLLISPLLDLSFYLYAL